MRARTCKVLMAAAAATLFSLPVAASWKDEASAYDVGRLEKIDEARAKGLAEAQSGRDAGVIHAVLDAEARPASAHDLEGAWRCRTIKLGGLTPDIAYSWFRCRIDGRGQGLYFEKLSGSQRLRGYLYPHQSGGYVLLAGLSAKGEPAHSYSGNGPSAGAVTTPDDAVGLLVATGQRSARVEMPYPGAESTFDVIELRR
ncbi:MAG TPA: DUF4893 domain-containing protein [Rhizomicrobium sp.]|jgi:hypothetical protein|nr:DUF4893 domain-containing protein [Rhizomicrobium sp.]